MVSVRFFCEWIRVPISMEKFLFDEVEFIRKSVFPELKVNSIPRRDGFLDIYVNMFPVDSSVACKLLECFSRVRFNEVQESVMMKTVISYVDDVHEEI